MYLDSGKQEAEADLSVCAAVAEAQVQTRKTLIAFYRLREHLPLSR